ncbi:hypothetical protein DL764_003588 [Monosporascus ibericus]|uniref:NADP-dependent oxidoreductase domain-containing protein n=1 Tax=Monosporascus ibericus TaxID=155417 RepID=A0A4Q4TG06_9PEZI|nr:hypothetical protein DL764_003588 [Monosporascus ibericus]
MDNRTQTASGSNPYTEAPDTGTTRTYEFNVRGAVLTSSSGAPRLYNKPEAFWLRANLRKCSLARQPLPLAAVYYNDADDTDALLGSTAWDVPDPGTCASDELALTRLHRPMRVHGLNMYMLAAGPENYTPEGDSDSIAALADSPPHRCVQNVPPFAQVAVQMDVREPDLWPFRCHIDLHAPAGFFSQMLLLPDEVAAASSYEVPEAVERSCAEWREFTPRGPIIRSIASSVPLHPLGKNGPSVPALGFGLMGLSLQTYGSVPNDEERFAVLDRAVELGATFWDTSDLYGDSEELLGKWIKRTGKRDQVFLATKFGLIQKGHSFEVNSSAAYCKQACAESLKRLGVDSIDLYYMHSANRETPIEETMRALAELKAYVFEPLLYEEVVLSIATNEMAHSREGKIKHIGLSSVTSNTLRRACKIAPVAAVQTEYSVFDRAIEGPAGTDLLATCRELGVAVVVATPLGRGLLTTPFSEGESISAADIRPQFMPRFQEANREKNVKAVGQFRALADKKGCTVAQLALAWLLKQGGDIFPIPGTKRINYLEENWASLDVSLTDEEDAEIRAFGKATELAGGSLPEKFAGEFFRDTKEESS